MFDPSDPRASLALASQGAQPSALAGAEYLKFYELEPDEETGDRRTWYARAQNVVVEFSEASAGAAFSRNGQPDEYVVLLPDRAAGAVVQAGSEMLEAAGYSVLIVPAGSSRITLTGTGRIARIFTAEATDLAERCSNAGSYAQPKANVGPYEPWPAPPSGSHVRCYSLDVPSEPGRFGRIFRCSTMMVNYLEPYVGPRDRTKLSPHHHDDFEQSSLVLDGEFVHHLRWPWLTDSTQWREDEHVHCAGPSLTVIPPPSVHTSEAVGAGDNLLVDIFCPPRLDFAEQPGWVLNADDYPLT